MDTSRFESLSNRRRRSRLNAAAVAEHQPVAGRLADDRYIERFPLKKSGHADTADLFHRCSDDEDIGSKVTFE